MNLVILVEVFNLFNYFLSMKICIFKDLNRFRPVYSAKDFLDVICVLVNPNLKIDESLWKLDIFQIMFFLFNFSI